MCGIAGAWLPGSGHGRDSLQALGERMAATIAHRGPDDSGTWVEAESGLVLAHRRLAILDLSPEGHQPMVSTDRRWVVAFNGEIYNHHALREELAVLGHGFRGHSDTEVLVTAIMQWGVEATLHRCNGMLALAAWDMRERVLWLARDRVGKKPVYYGWTGDGSFVFGSELSALRAHPALQAEVDPDALALLLRLDYIPAPYAILRGVHKLQAGCLLRVDAARVDAGAGNFDPMAAPTHWWDALEQQRAAILRGFDGDESDALDALDCLLRDATALRMEADVPLGAFLSGGTDSSLVTALMQAQSARPVRSFSIGFDNAIHDESAHAAAVARHLGTDHVELRVDGHAALELVPAIPQIFDEPFADSSQLPTALLCQLARKHVTVALSGDGGDELFFGYGRYARALRNDAWLSRLPRAALARIAGDPGEAARLGGLPALRAELAAGDLQGLMRQRVERWHRPEDILAKVDRASMAVSLEARAPLLDWRVVELAWSLPLSMKWRDGTLKHLPKRLLARYLPEALVQRPKSGFGAPVGDWLRGPLRDWAEAQLDESRLREEGHFDPAPIRAIWRDFLAGERKWHTHLWGVLMFQAWREGIR